MRALLPLFIASAFATVAPSAQASRLYCVTNTAEMTFAIDAAHHDFEDSEIRIESGTYSAPAGGWTYAPVPFEYFTDLKISGGWQPGTQCTTQLYDSTLTKLSGGGSRRILRIYRDNGNTSTLEISRLSFVHGFNGNGDDLESLGLALHVDASLHDGPIILEHLIVRDNAAIEGLNAIVVSHKGPLYFRNNLVVDNEAGSGTMGVSIVTEGTSYLVNNTIAHNRVLSAPSAVTGLHVLPTVGHSAYATNNIVWDNGAGGSDVDFKAYSATLMIANAVERFSGAPSVGSAPPIDESPGFDANWRLAPSSLLHDVGVNVPFGGQSITDLAGQVRKLGAGTDLGAYETAFVPGPQAPDAIFKNGLE